MIWFLFILLFKLVDHGYKSERKKYIEIEKHKIWINAFTNNL